MLDVPRIAKSLEDAVRYFHGLEGENRIRTVLGTAKIPYMQIDLMVFAHDRYHIFEVKHQEPFEPPPFLGHGLPPGQVESRLRLFEKTGIMPWLFICDCKSKQIFYQDMLTLQRLPNEEKFLTLTGKRVVFPIDRFRLFTGGLDLSIVL